MLQRKKMHRATLSPSFFEKEFLGFDSYSRWAAYNVALNATDYDTLIIMIEGGVWRDPGFMPRTSCIWTSLPNASSPVEDVRKSNVDAANFIAQAEMEIDTFILTFKNVSNPDV